MALSDLRCFPDTLASISELTFLLILYFLVSCPSLLTCVTHIFRKLKSQQPSDKQPSYWLKNIFSGSFLPSKSVLLAQCSLCICRSCSTIIWSRKMMRQKAKSSTWRWREITIATWLRWLMKTKSRVSQPLDNRHKFFGSVPSLQKEEMAPPTAEKS